MYLPRPLKELSTMIHVTHEIVIIIFRTNVFLKQIHIFCSFYFCVITCFIFITHSHCVKIIFSVLYYIMYSFNYIIFFPIPLGVADGVGGWRNFGFDPSKFSYNLMETCERLVVTGRFNPRNPGHLIATSYYELKENKEQIIGRF